MSARDDVPIVRRFFEAIRDLGEDDRGRFEEAVRELCSPNVVVVPSSALAAGSAGPFNGLEAVLELQDAILTQWSEFELTLDDFVELPPGIVVALGRLAAKRGDGSGYAAEVGCVTRLENGRITSVQAYRSKRRALREAKKRAALPDSSSQPAEEQP